MKNTLIGVIVCLAAALVSSAAVNVLPGHFIGAGVLALFIGMLLNPYVRTYKQGFQLVSKKLLRVAIVLMGLSLHLSKVAQVGMFSLVVMSFTLFTAFAGGYYLGKWLGMDWKLSGLISAGTGICGGSAIAAIAPVIEADDHYVAYAISATFVFDVLMVVLFPIMGRAFAMTDLGFGLWTGTAINDTSSVVAAGYAFSDAAGQMAVIVKLTRTLSILPVVLIFSWINERQYRNHTHQRVRVNMKKIFPWFIILFLVMVGVNTLDLLPELWITYAVRFSKFAMVMALAAIGLNTDIKKMMTSGIAPFIHGFSISALVVLVAYMVQMVMGQL